MNDLPHIVSRIFNVPLLIEPGKAQTILGVLEPRLLDGAKLYGPGDKQGKKEYFVTEDGIAVISIVGSLVNRGSWLDAMSGMASYASIQTEIEDAATDPAVKGIILDMDSPGGEAAGTFDLADAIYSLRGLKPIWAVANQMAFSAAYAIASAADQIILSRTAGVGSIGVISIHRDQSAKNKADGYKYTFITAGAHKADLSPHRPISDEAQGTVQAQVDRLYGLFTTTVARNRGMSIDDVTATEAGLFFGDDAVENNLADSVGTLNDAIANMKSSLNNASKQTNRVGSRAEVTPMATETADKTAAVQPVVAEVAPVVAAPESNVVALDAARSDGEQRARAHASQVIELCGLAGKPNLAGGFIAAGKPIDDVRTALLAAKAAEGDAAGIDNSTRPGTGTGEPAQSIDTNAIYASRKMKTGA